jgi:MFS family permease
VTGLQVAVLIIIGVIFYGGLTFALIFPKTRRVGLLATVFLSGAALMSLEMVSFRLVQPDLGSDIIVTGSLISVFLGGLALGAFLGGMLADRWPHLLVLGIILVVAGLWTLIIPEISDPVMGWVAPSAPPLPPEWGLTPESTDSTHEGPDLRVAAIVVGMVLFAIPTILMGMVTPYTARLFVHKLPRMGTGVGLIYGISTFGSILGTLITTFYLMTFLGTRYLAWGNGGVLGILGLVLAIVGIILLIKTDDLAIDKS